MPRLRTNLAAVALACALWSPGAPAQAAPAAQVDLQALVRRAAENAIANGRDTSRLYRYRSTKETNSGKALRDMVETKQVILARTVRWNDRDLTTEERAKEDARLDAVVRSTEELKKKKAEQDADRKRTLQVVRALPDALIFKHDGTEVINGREALRLSFTPNPDFSPTAKETYGLKAAVGKLWIDKEHSQIVKMDAALTENVYIGWGILGHINKGGRLELEHSLVPGNAWRITKLNIEATGKVFFFKNIKVKNRQTAWDFRPVPSDLTVAQAVAALKQNGGTPVVSAATP